MSDRIELEAYVTPEPPAGAVDAVMRAVAERGAGEVVADGRPSRWPLVAAAVVAVAAAVVLLVLLRGGGGDDGERPAPAVAGDELRDAADDGDREAREALPERVAGDKLVRRLADREAREKLLVAIAQARQAREARAATGGGAAGGGGGAGGGVVLDKESIREAMGEVRPLLIECYEMALERDPELGGTLRAEFTIVGEEEVGGLVGELVLDADDGMARDEELMTCLHETIMSLELPPPPGGGEITVRYPFVFRNGDEGDDDVGEPPVPWRRGGRNDDGSAKRPTHGLPGSGGSGDAGGLTKKAQELAKSGRYGEALRTCEVALGIDDGDQEARMVCAIAACNLRSVERASRHLRALANDSRRAMARQICLKNGIEIDE